MAKCCRRKSRRLDQTLDRIDVLMEQLGIGMDDDDADEEADEDMYRLLKGER